MKEYSTEVLGMLEFAIRRYGLITNISVDTPMADIGFIGGSSYRVPLGTTIKLEITTTKDGISALAEDLEKIRNLRIEEKLRMTNPTLQSAWEEYQLLLKLSE